MKMNYDRIDSLRNIYLEDSFVLDVVEKPGCIVFEIDAVLMAEHSMYERPKVGEQYCYRKAKLVFPNVKRIDWKRKTFTASIDADNSVDYGNIDSFTWSNGTFKLSGDWGCVEITSDAPSIKF